MNLIQLSDDGTYLELTLNNKILNIRHTLLKKLVYSTNSESISLILYKNRIVNINYYSTEDPNNPGNLFTDMDALWNWLLGVINGSISPFPIDALTNNNEELLTDIHNNNITA